MDLLSVLNIMDYIYENIDGYNPNRNRKVLIVLDDMIVDIMGNEKIQAIIKKLFIRCRKLSISFVFNTQSYFSIPKDVTLNSTHLIMKINNNRELRNIAINHSADVIKILWRFTEDIQKNQGNFSFLTVNKTLLAVNSLKFSQNLFQSYRHDSTNQIKILDDKIISNEEQYDLGRKETKVSVPSSKTLLDKYGYFTDEGWGYKPNVFEKAQFEYSLLGMSLRKAFRKDEVKSAGKSKSDLTFYSNHNFHNSFEGYNGFGEMSH